MHKYELAYVIATRRPLDAHNELAELFYAHTIWLGPLSESDIAWNVGRYARRNALAWDGATAQQIGALSSGYPALLRAICEAHAAGCPLALAELSQHPTVQRRLAEFWADQPEAAMLRHSGLSDNPLLAASRNPAQVDTAGLTLKEHALWEYLQAHPGQVCEKDDLIRAIWPEDRIFERGVRDDSLAQLVRRLARKGRARSIESTLHPDSGRARLPVHSQRHNVADASARFRRSDEPRRPSPPFQSIDP